VATIPITLVGKSFTDGNGNTTFVGQAFTTGLQVGGGPMPGGPPLGIWGGGGVGNYPDAGFPGPQPGGPIGIWGGSGVGDYIDAGLPGPQPGGPIGIWGPNDPRPSNPISGIPGLPGGPGQQPGGGGNGPGRWRWVYSPRYGWVLDPGSGGKPQPPGVGGGGQYPDQSLPDPQPLPDQSLPEPQA
jgi:hypothetical protein